MSSTYYLVDYENINNLEIVNFDKASEDDVIELFYTNNTAKMKLDSLLGMKARFRVHKVNPGKQSLDMHLISFLGYLIGRYGNEFKYVICSRDKDYLAPIEFWKTEAGVDICTRSVIPNEDKTIEDGQKVCSADEKTKANARIMQALAAEGIDSATTGATASIVMKHYEKTKTKQLVYRDIIKMYGMKNGARIYSIVKPLLS